MPRSRRCKAAAAGHWRAGIARLGALAALARCGATHAAGALAAPGLPRAVRLPHRHAGIGVRAGGPPRQGPRAEGIEEVFEILSREPPPRVRSRALDPPPETGRNPEAVATDLISGVFLIPGAALAFLATFLLAGYLRVALAPPAKVPLSEALSALVAIEDAYQSAGPSIGLRQRITSWFQWAQLDRRVAVEVEGMTGPARARAEERGKSAVEFLAGVVEYSGYSANGIGDRFETGRMADRVAKDQASRGYSESEVFAAQALTAGRQALQDAVQIISEERAQAEIDD